MSIQNDIVFINPIIPISVKAIHLAFHHFTDVLTGRNSLKMARFLNYKAKSNESTKRNNIVHLNIHRAPEVTLMFINQFSSSYHAGNKTNHGQD